MQNLTRNDLVAAFHTYGRDVSDWRVGVELERHLLRPDGTPVPYFGDFGVRWLIERLLERGYEPYLEPDPTTAGRKNPIAAFRDGASVTLEPGNQFEYSTAPFRDVTGVADQAAGFVREVDTIIAQHHAPITPVALGFTPFSDIESIQWVPKGRYVVMREHLATTGKLGHAMMKGTCAVQASFDFADEADCAEKVRLGMWLGPLTTAMFANSPLTAGKPNGYQSFRGKIWTDTDPRRTGFPEAATSFSFERWVDYLLDVPMMFIKGAEGWVPARGRTFRDWMAQGIDGHYPDTAAWDLHLTSVFPEVRVKRLIEIRGADCVAPDLAMAFTAYFLGLMYDTTARHAALDALGEFAAAGTSVNRFDQACRLGLGGVVAGRTMADWAGQMVELARAGLERWSPTDVHWLAPLEQQVATGESPAAAVLRAFHALPDRHAFLESVRYR
jgi:glutamate--cysteine ligase